METNLNSWFNNQPLHQQASYINSLSSPFSPGKLNDGSPNEILAKLAFSGVPGLQQCQTSEYHSLFYGPSHHQAFGDVANTLSHSKSPHLNDMACDPASMPAQKRFLVFDQSGDRTTMFYSPAMGTPGPLTSEVPKQEIIYTRDEFHHEPIFTYAYNKRERDEIESEIREDTEELNALLYSDDDYYEDEEEESTGHSPSTLTYFNGEYGEDKEEVASNFGPVKRIKLLNGNPADLKVSSEYEDDAESSCGDGENLDLGNFGILAGKKRSRKDQIKDTLSLLKSIIPGENNKNKDALQVFDDAIDYLMFLKVEAQALGVHTM